MDEELRPMPGKPQGVPVANGNTLWKVIDPLGCEIYLSLDTEEHILEGHPEMKDYWDAVKLTIQDPALIQRDGADGTTCYYYRLAGRNFFKHKDIYVSVVVHRDEVRGRIKTAHLVRHLRNNPGETIWLKTNVK